MQLIHLEADLLAARRRSRSHTDGGTPGGCGAHYNVAWDLGIKAGGGGRGQSGKARIYRVVYL